MKKLYVGLAVLAVFGYLAFLGVGAAQAWGGDGQNCTGDCQGGPRAGQEGWPPQAGVLSEYESILDNALSKVLNLSVDEIQAARDSGTTWASLASQQGVALEDLQQAIADAHKTMVDEALADGEITQAQADAMSARIDEGPGFGFQSHAGQMAGGGMQGPAFGGRGAFGCR
jgi:hypothetical protein